MRNFLLRLLLFFALIFAFDQLAGMVMTYINNHTVKGDYGRNNYICTQANQDILIFGSSRAIHHYNTRIISDNLHKTCYNCGQDGMGIICSYGRYSLIKQRYKPQLIVCDIEVAYDVLKDDNTRYLGFLRPYYGHDVIDSIFNNVSENEKYKMLSNLYRYNSRWLDIVAQFRSGSKVIAKDYNYSPLKGTLNYEPDKYVFHTKKDCDSLKLYYLEKLIQDCRANGTKLAFAISPVYGETVNHLIRPFADICKKYDIPLLDHFADSCFILNRELFKDKKHLNEKGATQYSELIASEFEKLL